MNIKIIKSESKRNFEEEIEETTKDRNVADIKFIVNPTIHSSTFGGSYSSGETYYAMIIFE